MKRPDVICIIMGGGRGSRLYPLTKERCKPAVPIGARYRLVDIPISNCVNSGYNKIFVLSQFRTASLHRHIQRTYHFDSFGEGFVEILSAEQTDNNEQWYQGTADAVRQNMHHFDAAHDDDIYVILSGDQLYSMDIRKVIEHHKEMGADITVSATPVESSEVSGFGVMRVRDDYSIEEFVEKPEDPEVIGGLEISDKLKGGLTTVDQSKDYCLASMGIYVFTGKVIRDALAESDATDFGKEIIPGLLERKKLVSYIFDDYWEDIGTVKAFFDANLMLTDDAPDWDFSKHDFTFYSRSRQLPPTKVIDCEIASAVWGDGCTLRGAVIKRCLIGIRSSVKEGTVLDNVLMMGADSCESPDHQSRADTGVPLGIGRNCHITEAIIDKNVRIGDNVKLSPKGLPDKYEEKGVYVRDGVLIVLKGAVIPDGTVIGE